MKILGWCGVLSVLLIECSVAQTTVTLDQTAKQRLLGEHRLALQWISWNHFGKATVVERAGSLYLTGEQRDRKNKDNLLQIDGAITEIGAQYFKFKGQITTRIDSLNDGQTCVRNGEYTFRITGKRQYWRLQEAMNPCDGMTTDYIDIFFK